MRVGLIGELNHSKDLLLCRLNEIEPHIINVHDHDLYEWLKSEIEDSKIAKIELDFSKHRFSAIAIADEFLISRSDILIISCGKLSPRLRIAKKYASRNGILVNCITDIDSHIDREN